ncbi:MAG: hypothetical protein RLZZ227_1071 [Pseudomonadota bacterium]
MHRLLNVACVALMAALVGCQPVARAPEPPALPQRIVSDIGSPQRVFARPVTEIVPGLQGARASGPNGRVGTELVFWGYELEGTGPAYLAACAFLSDTECEARLPEVCPSGAIEVLSRHEESGKVRYLDCQAIGVASPGDLTPTCADTADVQPVTVTLLSCN